MQQEQERAEHSVTGHFLQSSVASGNSAVPGQGLGPTEVQQVLHVSGISENFGVGMFTISLLNKVPFALGIISTEEEHNRCCVHSSLLYKAIVCLCSVTSLPHPHCISLFSLTLVK